MGIKIKQVNTGNIELKAPIAYIKPTGRLKIEDNGLFDVSNYAEAEVEIEKGIIPNGTITITENGEYFISNYMYAKVDIEVIEPTGQIELKTNGTHNVKEYAEAVVNVETQKPTGTIEIKDNGLHDVSDYANANVNIEVPQPTGTIELNYNGTYNVSDYAEAVVNVEGGASKYAPRFISFNNCQLKDLQPEVDGLDTSNMTTMKDMFYYTNYLTGNTLDVSHFNLQNVTTVERMFGNCGAKVINIAFSNFNKITTMRNMFQYCRNTEQIITPTTPIEVPVTTMNAAFQDNEDVKRLDLSAFIMNKLTNMGSTFNGCRALEFLDIRNINLTTVTTTSSMLNYVPTTCLIIVKDDASKTKLVELYASRTDYIKTVAEYQAMGGA